MCLSTRWRDIAAVLTGFDQTGFVADRFMDWNNRKFLDGMHYAREMRIDCALVLFDFKKAYDNVSLAFLFAILDIMCGVPFDLVWEDLQRAQACPPGEYEYQHSAPPTRWIQTLYLKHLRTVSVNGTTTAWFLLESTVPQGDCLAPTAFILYIEALGILLRTNPNINGIRLPSGDTLVATRFADDTGSLVTPPSLPYVMQDVEVFSAASGMVNHIIKTLGAWAGALWQKAEPWSEAAFLGDLTVDGGKPRLTWLPPGYVMGLLGVLLGYDVDESIEWNKIASSMLAVLCMWSAVPLSIRARADLVKCLVWSKAWFLSNYRWMPDRLRDKMWAVSVYFVVKGHVPAGFSLSGDGNTVPRHFIGANELARPYHLAGINLWPPRVHMVAQLVKVFAALLVPDRRNRQVVSARFPSITHASWKELAWIYVSRLNWQGALRGRHADGRRLLPGECNRTDSGRGCSVLVEGMVLSPQVKRAKSLGLPPQWDAALRSYGEIHALSVAAPPTIYEEILAMNVFGSPYVLEDDSQLWRWSVHFKTNSILTRRKGWFEWVR